jgi:hypothetical protein
LFGRRDSPSGWDGKRAAALREHLYHDCRRVADYQYRLAYSLCNIASIHCNNGHPEEALAQCARALEVAEQLARAHPDVPTYTNRVVFIRIVNLELCM